MLNWMTIEKCTQYDMYSHCIHLFPLCAYLSMSAVLTYLNCSASLPGLKMYENWKEIEDNENIKKEFADYFYGLMRHDKTGLVLPPKGAANIPLYQVNIILCNKRKK